MSGGATTSRHVGHVYYNNSCKKSKDNKILQTLKDKHRIYIISMYYMTQ